MTGPLKRLGAIVPRVIRKFLKRIDPQRVLVGLTPASHSFYHTSVNKAALFLKSSLFFRFFFFFFFPGHGHSQARDQARATEVIRPNP